MTVPEKTHPSVTVLVLGLVLSAAACTGDDASSPDMATDNQTPDSRRLDLFSPDAPATSKLPLLLDVDMGLDDARVVLALPGQDTFQVLGIVTVEGSAGAAKGADNALRLLAALGVHDIPVAVGESKAIKGPIPTPAWRSMAEGLGGLNLPAAQRKVETAAGKDFIVKALRQSAQPVTMLAIGPLTNLARALDQDATLAKKIRALYLLGDFVGCTSYNCTTDLEAAKRVFAHKVPTVMVLSSAAASAPFDQAFLAKVQALGSPAGKLVATMMAGHSSGVMKLWDDAALGTALDEKLGTFTTQDATTRQVVSLDVPGLHKLLLSLWGPSA